MKDAAPDALRRKVAEVSLDHVQPGRARGREMHVETWMPRKPTLDGRMFVRRVVVGNKVNGKVLRHRGIDHAQELQPFLVAMPPHARADDRSIQRVQRSKERGGSIALVVMRHRGAVAARERKPRLGSIQRLDLALLVQAEDDRVLGRVQIETDDFFEFLGESRIVAHLEGPHLVRFDSIAAPDSKHARFTDAHLPCQTGGTPVCCAFGHVARGHLDHTLDYILADRGEAARPIGIDLDPLYAARDET